MPNTKATRTSGSQRGPSWLLSAAISVVVVVLANLTIFAVAAVFLINTAEAESTEPRPLSMLLAAPVPEVAKLASPAPAPRIAPIQGVVVAPVRYATVVPRKKCPVASPEQKTASLRIARQKNSAGRNAL